MDKLRQAAKQTLDYWESCGFGDAVMVEKMAALRAALAEQPAEQEQEPQRWAVFCAGCRKEWSVPYQHPGKSVCDECTAKLKAQPQQEPYAWMAVGGTIWRHKTTEDDVPLYTAPQPAKREPLTDEEIEEINVSLAGRRDLARMFARAIEARILGGKT